MKRAHRSGLPPVTSFPFLNSWPGAFLITVCMSHFPGAAAAGTHNCSCKLNIYTKLHLRSMGEVRVCGGVSMLHCGGFPVEYLHAGPRKKALKM